MTLVEKGGFDNVRLSFSMRPSGSIAPPSCPALEEREHPGGTYEQYGSSTSGTANVLPQLAATGPFRPGHDSSLILRSGAKNTPALLVAGVSASNLVNFPWVDVNTYVWSQPFQALVGLDARGTWSLSARLDPSLSGSSLFFQAYVLDPTATVGIISSNGVRVQYGR